MKDSFRIEVTGATDENISFINQSAELLFRKQSGIEKLLPSAADRYANCPLLQIYTAIMYFFPFSARTIQEKMPVYLEKIKAAPTPLTKREALHFKGLQSISSLNLAEALPYYLDIVREFPQDKVAILMVETCGFLSGQIESLAEPYQALYAHHSKDADFLGMFAFLLAHTNRLSEARKHVEDALQLSPHNAWVQHVYAHTLDETNIEEIKRGIGFLEPRVEDWPKQNRFFEGHNWMHLCGLYLASGTPNIDKILSAYPQHIWGEAKEFNFEQNNAFWVLWQLEMHGYGKKIPAEWRSDLAAHAEPFMTDYLTPYLTVTSILSVAQSDLSRAQPGLSAFEQYASALQKGSDQYHAWQEMALPVLQGCLDYLRGDLQGAHQKLKSVVHDTRAMGHSDEQRSIFSATFTAIQQKLQKKSLDSQGAFALEL